jgi:periplasmic divalent cation tolerance protein
MTIDGKFILIYATFRNLEAAEAVGATLVDRGLAACVNILPGMISLYVWDGRRQREQEVAMLIKTRAELAARVMSLIRAAHPSDNPAMLEIPVTGGSADFLAWITARTVDIPNPTPANP